MPVKESAHSMNLNQSLGSASARDTDESSVRSSQLGSQASEVAAPLQEPVLDETLCSTPLYKSFLAYMNQQYAGENVKFLRDVDAFQRLVRPRREVVAEAKRITWIYILSGAPLQVNVSSELREELEHVVWDYSGSDLVNNNMFDKCEQEIRILLAPHYKDWLATRAWVGVKYRPQAAPSFTDVLTTPALTQQFTEFLRARIESGSKSGSKTGAHDLQMFEFCVEAQRIRDLVEASMSASPAVRARVEGIAIEDESREVYRKYKKVVSIPHKGDVYSSGLLTALYTTTAYFMDGSVSFKLWLERKTYIPVAYPSKMVLQSLTANGYIHVPNLAIILHTPELSALASAFLRDTPQIHLFNLLRDIINFRTTYANTDDAAVLKAMKNDARTIYKTYFKSGGTSFASSASSGNIASEPELPMAGGIPYSPSAGQLSSPTGLVSKAGTSENGGVHGGVLPLPNIVGAGDAFVNAPKAFVNDIHHNLSRPFATMFDKLGAYVYTVSVRTWVREFLNQNLWTQEEYETHNATAAATAEIFSINKLDAQMQKSFATPPLPDDIVSDARLRASFEAFIAQDTKPANKQFRDMIPVLRTITDTFEQCHEGESLSVARQVITRLRDLIEGHKWLAPIFTDLQNGITRPGRKSVGTSLFWFVKNTLYQELMATYYASYIRTRAYLQCRWSFARVCELTDLVRIRPRLHDCSTSGPILPILTTTTAGGEAVPLLPGSNSMSPASSPYQSLPLSAASAQVTLGRSPKTTLLSGVDPRRMNSPLLSSPKVPLLGGPGSSSGIVSTLLPRIPTIEDTLDSALLREFFYKAFAKMRFTDDEDALWAATSEFYATYSHLKDADVLARQPDARRDAQAIVQKFAGRFSDSAALLSTLGSKTFISHNFFRQEEIYVFKRQHAAYESLLQKKGWQP